MADDSGGRLDEYYSLHYPFNSKGGCGHGCITECQILLTRIGIVSSASELTGNNQRNGVDSAPIWMIKGSALFRPGFRAAIPFQA